MCCCLRSRVVEVPSRFRNFFFTFVYVSDVVVSYVVVIRCGRVCREIFLTHVLLFKIKGGGGAEPISKFFFYASDVVVSCRDST